MEYTVVSENSVDKLEQYVAAYLSEGWKLQGGVSVAVDQGRYEYVQAMIKESK